MRSQRDSNPIQFNPNPSPYQHTVQWLWYQDDENNVFLSFAFGNECMVIKSEMKANCSVAR
jgi:hypothetical protein